MKKNFLKLISSVLFAALLIMGCQKITEEELTQEDQLSEKGPQNQANAKDKDDDNGCRFSSLVTNYGYSENFHYNHKGLADKWLIDFGDGTVNDYRIMYDRRDRIKSIQVIFPGDAVNYTFYNDDNHTNRATGRLQSTGELYDDIYYSYNRKGQMVRLDDIVNDVHSRFYYNQQGFNTRIDFYIGTELYYTYFLKYDIPNKNPYLALNGVDFWFPSYTYLAPLWDKRWNSSGSIVVYEEGNPIVIAEDDPAQTVIHTGRGNYATYASYYDIPSESSYEMVFSYSNCGRGNDNNNNNETIPAATFKKNSPMSTTTRLKKILGSHSKNRKQELLEFKRQCLQQIKTRNN